MEFVCNLMTAQVPPVEWARDREAEGWDVLAVADHLTSGTGYPHVWSTCGAVAAVTATARLTTAFVNNLLRSPVEVGQAARTLQLISNGRFELGLGAGWMRAEHERAGLEFPPAAERADRYIEAVQIVRQLLDRGACCFHGRHYDIEIDAIGPADISPPRLIGSVGGPRTIAEVTPWCDAVEIKAASAATRGGDFDWATLGAIPSKIVGDLVARVRAVRPDIPIGMFVICGCGESAAFGERFLPGSFYSRFFGKPGDVAEAVVALADEGISRAQLSPFDNETLGLLASQLPLSLSAK